METPVSPKVTVAVLAAAIVTILVYAIDAIWHTEIPVLVQGAVTTGIIGVASWLKKDHLRTAGAAAVAASPDTVVGTIPEIAEVKATT